MAALSSDARSGAAAVATGTRIDGKSMAADVQSQVKAWVEDLKASHGVVPGLGIVLVGDRPDSAMYVRLKQRAAKKCGVQCTVVKCNATVDQADLEMQVDKLMSDEGVHGVLVQLPLPEHIDEHSVLKRIGANKDVDGLGAENIGNLHLRGGEPPAVVACTPAGVIEMLQRSGVKVKGKYAVVLGRSNLVGMPVAALLQSMNATVTVCHSATPESLMVEHVKRADILVSAVGQPEIVRGEWLKPGVVIIDVGITDVPDPSKKRGYRLAGDVLYEEAIKVASAVAPVPGGVGPMTVAMLMRNTVMLCRRCLGLTRIKLRSDRDGVNP